MEEDLARKRLTVAQLAAESHLALDDVLIALWDAGFDSIKSPSDQLRKGDANRARRALGLATRRELADIEYWQGRLGMDEESINNLLVSLGINHLVESGKLRKKAINRLRAELKSRGVPQVEIEIEADEPLAGDQYEPLVWVEVGHKRPMVYLTPDQLEGIHTALAEDFIGTPDPINPPGVRDRVLLGSAAYRPQTAVDGVLKYPTVELAAAALLHAIVHNHPFHNGNKRTGLVSMLVFLDENSIVVTCEEEDLFRLVLKLAQHALVVGPRGELADREVSGVAQWLAGCSRFVEKGDRAIPLRRLRRILAEFDCTLEFASGGSRINLLRAINRPGTIWRRSRVEVLRTQVAYGGEGREVDKNTINMIRRELELDEIHGIDSGSFYDRAPVPPSEFIVKYRKTLRRLAKL